MVKKIFPLILFTVLICGALTACGVISIVDQAINILQSEDEHITMVKNGSPTAYPGKTYGDAFEKFFGSPTWTYFEGSMDGSSEICDIVEFTGYCTYQDVEVKALIQFIIDGEGESFTAAYLSFNEVSQDMFMLAALMEAVFTNDDVKINAENNPVPETPNEPADSNAATADISFEGEYEMLSAYKNMGAVLSISVVNGRYIYVEGIANYQDHAGEVTGEAQLIDSNHFYIEMDGNRLDMIYNENTDTLTVEETGGFGGSGVTFEGTYVRTGSTAETGEDAYLFEFAELCCSDPSALYSEDENEYNTFIQFVKEDYDQWLAGTAFHYIVIDRTGHLAIDYDIAEAEGIVGLW